MANSKDDWRGNLRLPREIHDAILERCSARPGAVSLNTWITEAIVEQLAKDGKQGRNSTP